MSQRTRIQAKDIADAEFLEVVRRYNEGDESTAMAAIRERNGYGPTETGRWAFVWDVAEVLGVEGRLAEAKAYKLIKRGLMSGCSARHWCRGDYELTDAGLRFLDESDPDREDAPDGGGAT